MRVIICSHEADIDGIYSASVALMKFPGASLSFHNNGLDNFKKMFDYIKNESRKSTAGLVVISDLGINDDKVSALCMDSIQYLKSRKWSVIWVDHHPWQKNGCCLLERCVNCFIIHLEKNVPPKSCMKNSCTRTGLLSN